MKIRLNTVLLSAILLMGATTTNAAPTTINFNNTAPASFFTDYTGTGYTESGFSLQAGAGTNLFTFNPGWDTAVDGTDFAEFEPATASPASITLSFNLPFSLLSFQADNSYHAQFGTLSPGSVISLTGHIVGGGTVNTTVTTAANGAWNTFTLGSGWTNLTSVVFTSAIEFIGMDNIVVDTAPQIPLPATIWLLLAGFAGIASSNTRKR